MTSTQVIIRGVELRVPASLGANALSTILAHFGANCGDRTNSVADGV